MRQLHAAALAGLPGRFLEAAAEPGLWSEVLSEASLASGEREDILRDYLSEAWFLVNRRPALAANRKLFGRAITERDFYGPGHYERDAFEQDFMGKRGLRSCLGAMVELPGAGAVTFTFEGWAKDGPFTAAEAAALDTLIPVFAQALRLGLPYRRGAPRHRRPCGRAQRGGRAPLRDGAAPRRRPSRRGVGDERSDAEGDDRRHAARLAPVRQPRLPARAPRDARSSQSHGAARRGRRPLRAREGDPLPDRPRRRAAPARSALAARSTRRPGPPGQASPPPARN